MILGQRVVARQMDKNVFFERIFPFFLYYPSTPKKYLWRTQSLAFFHQVESEIGYLPDSFSGDAVFVSYGFQGFFLGVFDQTVSLDDYISGSIFQR